MNLNKSQKKFLKKNLRKLSVLELAQKLGVSEKELSQYLKVKIGEEKLEKITTKAETSDNKSDMSSTRLNFRSWLKKNWLYLILLSCLAVGVYLNSLGNAFVSDDIATIQQNPNIGNFLYYLKTQFINSIRYFFYAIAFKISGLNPVAFRSINVFFHLGSVLAIFGIISLLYTAPLAVIVASLYAVHPLLSEAVVWISGGIHAQYTFFVLLSFLLYLIARNKNWTKKYYFTSLLSFELALMTTEKSAPFCLIVFAFEMARSSLKKNWQKIIPYFILSGICAGIVINGQFLSNRITALHTQYYQEGGLYNPLTQIPTAIYSYLSLLVWPAGLTLYHSELAFSPVQYAVMSLVTLLYFSAIIFLFLKKKYRDYSFWLVFLFISLLPMLTPLKIAWIVAERYVYLGSLGILVIIGLLIQKIGQWLKKPKISYLILAILVVALATRTYFRNKDWLNQDTLWIAAAKTSPSSPQNHNNLGDMYGRHGQYDKAVEEFQKAIYLLPNYADAYHNMANTYLQMNKIDLAIDSYQKAIQFNPNLWQSSQNLAAIYFQLSQYNLAEEYAQKAIQINPENPDLYRILGIIYLQEGKKAEAKTELQKAYQLNPNDQQTQQLLESAN